MKTVIRNGNVFDTGVLDFAGDATVVIEDGRIVSVGDGATGDIDLEIDARGRFVMPGFIDAHVHLRIGTMNFAKLASWTEVQFGIAMARLARETLERGFTTVRDTGGELGGLVRAIRDGEIEGPNIVRSSHMISQTGGHGDVEGGARPVPDCACQMRHTAMGIVADGPDAVRKAARHVLREGADFIKIHVSGGVASPSDPLDCVQYTKEEVAAAVQEARNRKTYVAAHAYTPEAITMAVENGVHSIEHGNLIDVGAAKAMKNNDAVMVPTLVTYQAMAEVGEMLGLPAINIEKNKLVLEEGLKAVGIARDAGVELGFGTDLLGEAQPWQNREFAIRVQMESARDILQSMYVVNPRLCHMEGEIGTLTPGARGDVVISKINPLDDIAALAEPANVLTTVIKGGKCVWAAA